MSKQITAEELAKIVTLLLTNANSVGELDDAKTFQSFMTAIAETVADHCGGELTGDAKLQDGVWLVGVTANDSLPEDGGIWKSYDVEGSLTDSPDVPDRLHQVTLPGAPDEPSTWAISPNLTDRWGDLNYHNAMNKPLEPLEDNPELLDALRAQMWGESTFIVRKDGQFGILFEVEFMSRESEEHAKDSDPTWYAGLKPHADMVPILLAGLAPIAEKFPAVEFCVPNESYIANDRPAVWAFVSNGLLDAAQLEELGKALQDI